MAQRLITSGPYAGAARLKKPTQKHRPAMWEGILGAVYAMNDAREIKYFDFNYEGARAWCGIDEDGRDPRTARGQDYSWNGKRDDVPTGRSVYICWVVEVRDLDHCGGCCGIGATYRWKDGFTCTDKGAKEVGPTIVSCKRCKRFASNKEAQAACYEDPETGSLTRREA